MTKGDTDGIFKVPLLDAPRPSPSLSFHPGVMSRDNQLETFVSSEHLTFVGGYRVCRPTLFAHPHRVDAQRERNAVHKVQPKGEPPAISELACCLCAFSLAHQLSSAL